MTGASVTLLCGPCGGDEGRDACPVCRGDGYVIRAEDAGVEVRCERCGGEGCLVCDGAGVVDVYAGCAAAEDWRVTA